MVIEFGKKYSIYFVASSLETVHSEAHSTMKRPLPEKRVRQLRGHCLYTTPVQKSSKTEEAGIHIKQLARYWQKNLFDDLPGGGPPNYKKIQNTEVQHTEISNLCG